MAMLNPESYNLCNRAITAALTGETQTAIDGLEGILAATIQCRFAYGSGGTAAKAYVQTSVDGGETFIDVACFAFTTSSGVKVINLSGLTPVTTPITPSDAALADNTFVDGILGSIWRVRLTTTGTYANTNMVVSIEAR